MIFGKFRARPGRVKRLELELPTQGPWMIAVGALILAVLAWTWFNPLAVRGVQTSLTPGGEPLPTKLAPGQTPEEALAQQLHAVDADAVELAQVVLVPRWLEEDRLGVDQVRVLLVLSTGDDPVSATGRVDYTWARGDERPRTSHTNLQATGFRRGEVPGLGRDVVHKEVLRIDAPRADWQGQPIHVELTFAERRSAQATLVLEP